METDKKITLSLTGFESHEVRIPLGQGSFSIGSKKDSRAKFDVLVDEDLPIFWNTFDGFNTPAGSHWPRFFYYYGNDIGFVKWSEKRPIESFYWHPQKIIDVDLTNAQINYFMIKLEDSHIKITLGNNTNYLGLSGNIRYVDIKTADKVPLLSFSPITSKTDTEAYKLPVFHNLENLTMLNVHVDPLNQPFDCESLLQFPNLVYLNLSGNITNLHCLTKLERLEDIGLRYVPILNGFPSLTSWSNLKKFIAWNIDDVAGKRLRTELKNLSKERDLMYSTVSQLRKKIWFTTEYGVPFTSWGNKNEKIALKSYKQALKKMKKAKNENDAKGVITEFVESINTLPNIETSEREDVFEVVNLLVDVSPVLIEKEKALEWFDNVRDF